MISKPEVSGSASVSDRSLKEKGKELRCLPNISGLRSTFYLCVIFRCVWLGFFPLFILILHKVKLFGISFLRV